MTAAPPPGGEYSAVNLGTPYLTIFDVASYNASTSCSGTWQSAAAVRKSSGQLYLRKPL